MNQKHLIILGIRGVPAAHGGFESFAERFAPYMAQQGWDVTVYCQGSKTGKRYEDTWGGCRRIHIPENGNGAIGTIDFDIKSTLDAEKYKSAVFLTLGYNTAFLSAYLRLRGRFNIINMDGIEWKRAKYSRLQKIYLWINERLAVASGNVLVADHPEIARHHGSHTQPKKIVMIPYGSDRMEGAEEKLLDRFGVRRNQFLTVIARPEPENSLLEIVSAFSRRPRGVKLIVLGKYSMGHSYQNLVLSAASEEVIFPGAIYDKPTLQALRLFGIAYVHGHQVGGTNPSLVEALGAGNAVIAHDNLFNRWVAGDAGVYFSDEEECDILLDKLISSSELREKMRKSAEVRWNEAFTWPMILDAYHQTVEKFRPKS